MATKEVKPIILKGTSASGGNHKIWLWPEEENRVLHLHGTFQVEVPRPIMPHIPLLDCIEGDDRLGKVLAWCLLDMMGAKCEVVWARGTCGTLVDLHAKTPNGTPFRVEAKISRLACEEARGKPRIHWKFSKLHKAKFDIALCFGLVAWDKYQVNTEYLEEFIEAHEWTRMCTNSGEACELLEGSAVFVLPSDCEELSSISGGSVQMGARPKNPAKDKWHYRRTWGKRFFHLQELFREFFDGVDVAYSLKMDIDA